MNDWRQIEEWVKNCMIVNGLVAGARDTLPAFDKLGPKFCELGSSVIYEAGHRGATGVCDCLIHSMLSCLSSSFRKLKSESERNLIASFFRRRLLVEWERIGYLQNVDGDDLAARACVFLGERLGDEICRLLNINVLWVQKKLPGVPGSTANASFSDNESEYTISIHGDNAHFMPVLLKNSTDGQSTYILENFVGQFYIMECFSGTGRNAIKCDFQEGDIVTYNGEDWQVMQRRFANNNNGVIKKCIEIVLERIRDKKRVTVNVDDVKLVKKQGGRRTRSKRRMARKTRRSTRY
jgi:hypothetical protein